MLLFEDSPVATALVLYSICCSILLFFLFYKSLQREIKSTTDRSSSNTLTRHQISSSILELKQKLKLIETNEIYDFASESVKYFEKIISFIEYVKESKETSQIIVENNSNSNSILENELKQWNEIVERMQQNFSNHMSQLLQSKDAIQLEIQNLTQIIQMQSAVLQELEQLQTTTLKKLKLSQQMESTCKRELLETRRLLHEEQCNNKHLSQEITNLKKQQTPPKKSVSFSSDISSSTSFSPIIATDIFLDKNEFFEEKIETVATVTQRENVSTPRKRSFVNSLTSLNGEHEVLLQFFSFKDWFLSITKYHFTDSSNLVVYHIFEKQENHNSPVIQLWSSDLHGTFFEKEMYLVIQLEHQKYHLYCWFGKNCSTNAKELLLSRMQPFQINSFFVIIHLEEQYYESNKFLYLFTRTIQIYSKQYSQFISNPKRARLFVAKGNHRSRMFEVLCHVNSLQSKHVYVLEQETQFFIWKGKCSEVSALVCATNFCKQQNPNASIIILTENDARNSLKDGAIEFVKAISNNEENWIEMEEQKEDKELVSDDNIENPIKIYRVQFFDETISNFEYLGAMVDHFDSNSIYLIDVLDMNEIYVWIGMELFVANTLLEDLSWLKESILQHYTTQFKTQSIAAAIVVEKVLQYKDLKKNLKRLLENDDGLEEEEF